ncbi:copper amine oxidase N-terminal domain-containing protein [Brevibacillus migulae]|uniref:copper amine oxidase N-terminal domain-containing protein n=1 Tax=Brevibacillus migulae TaxID=1644114 RepID=UPI00106ECC86|nr:copper amine oxidase N-terminal domain-containing protein [Brevibacillus migulae]
MKKFLPMSLAVALAFSVIPAAYAQTLSVDAGVKASNSDENAGTKKNKKETKTQSDVSPTEATTEASTKASVKEAVKSKKQLIELRQQLKQSSEITADIKATYEELISSLEETNELAQAIEVQKELLEKTYKAGDLEPFKKLGKLYSKANAAGINTFVNGKEPEFDVEPFIHGGRTLVPVRAISSSLKADVKWDAPTRSVVITKGDISITLYLDKQEALVNGQTVTLDIVPVIKNGRVFLPLRFVSEQLKADVDWQQEGKIVIITDETDEIDTKEETGIETGDENTDETVDENTDESVDETSENANDETSVNEETTSSTDSDQTDSSSTENK